MNSRAASSNMVSSDVDAAPGIDHLPSSEARSAVWVGLYVSAARCLLAYVIAPAAGAIGFFLSPLGLALQILGTVTAVSGARRLWTLRHRGRIVYGTVAAALTIFTAGTTGHVVLGALR